MPINTISSSALIASLNDAPVITEVSVPTPVFPQAVGEFQVNTYTASNQQASVITALADGGFVVSWESPGQDGSGYGIYAQRYDAAGVAVGSEIQVNTYTSNHQQSPAIAAFSDGGFVVSWTSGGQDGSATGIYAQRYDAAGSKVGSEIHVNTHITSNQQEPAITALADGGFVVSWQSDGQDGDGWGIYAQRYDAQGSAVNGEFRVNTFTTSHQINPAITGLANGGFVVSWQSNVQYGDVWGICAQRYDEEGLPVGDEFRVNATTAYSQRYPAITALAEGGFVVSWTSYNQDGSFTGVYAQRYNADGGAVGAEFQVNTHTTNEQQRPALTALAEGGFVVSWQSYDQDGDLWGIYAQRYEADGNKLGAEFHVNTYTASHQQSSVITALADGGFVVSWQSSGQDGSGNGIYAQRYNAAGEPVTSGITLGYQGQLAATDPDGDSITWTIAADGDGANYGTASIDASGNWRFDIDYSSAAFIALADGETKTIALMVTANDGQNAANSSATHPLTFTITGINDAPVVADASVSGDEDSLIAIALSATDADSDIAGFKLSNLPPAGAFYADAAGTQVLDTSALISANNNQATIYFKPNADWHGNTSVSYQAVDSNAAATKSNTALITIEVVNVNDAPVITEVSAPRLTTAQAVGEFRVNTHTANNQSSPAITALADGGFVVSWDSMAQDGSGIGVYAQRYDDQGVAVGAELQVNTHTAFDQGGPAITALTDGGFVVSWISVGQDGSSNGIYAKRYDAAGNEALRPASLLNQATVVGNEFLVNTRTESIQQLATVTALDDGGFIISWESWSGHEFGFDIYAKRYDADGNEMPRHESLLNQASAEGNEFLINTTKETDQYAPTITTLSDGGFIVSWVNVQGANNVSIVAKRYTADGVEMPRPISLTQQELAQGNEFIISTNALAFQDQPARIAALQDGGFIVSWPAQDASGGGIYAKRYDAAGNEVVRSASLPSQQAAEGNAFLVNTATLGEQVELSIDSWEDGGFIISWVSENQDGSGDGVYAKRYTANGDEMDAAAGLKDQRGAQGNEFLVNTYTAADQVKPNVTTLADGGFVVSWQSSGQDGDGFGIYAQRFNAVGEAVTSGITLGYQGQLAATDADGDSITWTIAADGDGANYGTASIDASGNWRFDIDYSSAAFIALADGETKTITLTATANDGQNAANSAESYSVTFTITGRNDAPTISGNPATQVDRGTAYRFIPSVIDPDSDSLSFSAQGLPAWLSVDTATGEVSGIAPVEALNEHYTIELTVSDGVESATLSWNLSVVLPIGDITGLWLKDGELANERFGGSLALFDATGDGLAEVYVGSPTRTVEFSGKKLKNAGGIDVLASRNGALLHRVNATVAKQRFGFAIAVVADQNSDGIEDLVVGKPFAGKGGEIALHSGADGSVIRTLIKGEGKSASSITSIMPLCAIDPQHIVCRMLGSSEQGGRIGYSLAVAGVDGNGGADLIVGLPQANVKTPVKLNKAGSVIVYQGLSDTPRYVINGTQAGEALGASVAADDNYLLVGSPNFDVQAAKKLKDAGRVQLFNLQDGSTAGSTDGTAAKQLLGSAVASFNQDVNGDSEPDWAAAAAGDKSGKPVKLFTGMTQPAQFAEITASAPKKADAIRLAAGLDINGDGVSDLVIGLPSTKVTVPLNNKSKTLKNAGQVQVISGANWVP